MAVCNEIPGGISGDQRRRTIKYLVTAAMSDQDALNVLEVYAPITYDQMPRENVTVEEITKRAVLADGTQDFTVADGTYYGEAIYTRSSTERQLPEKNKNPDKADATTHKDSFSFESSLQSLREVYSPNGVSDIQSQVGGANPAGGTFGTIARPGMGYQGRERGFEGYDIRRPTSSFSLEWFPEDSVIDNTKEKLLLSAVGTVSSDVDFWGYAAGEVLCTSVTGRGRTTEDWSISARFEIALTVPSLDLGNSCVLTNVAGWDLVDVEYISTDEDIAGKKIVTKVARQATVWRVYPRKNFATIFAGLGT